MKYILGIFLLLMIAAPVYADCHQGQPCGPVPWQILPFPYVASPTPFPTVIATSGAAPSSTPTGTLTPAPTPTATAGLDVAAINNQMSTLQSVINATPSLQDRSQGFDLGHNANNVLNYVLGLQSIHFGVFTPLIELIFFGLFFIVGLKIAVFMLPIIVMLVGWLRKMIQLVLDFIPG